MRRVHPAVAIKKPKPSRFQRMINRTSDHSKAGIAWVANALRVKSPLFFNDIESIGPAMDHHQGKTIHAILKSCKNTPLHDKANEFFLQYALENNHQYVVKWLYEVGDLYVILWVDTRRAQHAIKNNDLHAFGQLLEDIKGRVNQEKPLMNVLQAVFESEGHAPAFFLQLMRYRVEDVRIGRAGGLFSLLKGSEVDPEIYEHAMLTALVCRMEKSVNRLFKIFDMYPPIKAKLDDLLSCIPEVYEGYQIDTRYATALKKIKKHYATEGQENKNNFIKAVRKAYEEEKVRSSNATQRRLFGHFGRAALVQPLLRSAEAPGAAGEGSAAAPEATARRGAVTMRRSISSAPAPGVC